MPAPAGPPVIAVVVPCYQETARILDVLAGIGDEVRDIIVVDDACPDRTGELVRERCTDPRVEVIVHDHNQGVGGATLTGLRRALSRDAQIIVKLDGDGQMDPADLPRLVAPIVQGRADYAKGNRFHDLDLLSRMPRGRLIGNLALSFVSKLSTGYWDMFDPTNGYVAIHARCAAELPLDKLSPGYFFESDMLFRLNVAGAVVEDVPLPPRYGDERSSLRVGREAFRFVLRHVRNVFKRVLYAYFLRDFNIASIELVAGNLLLAFGVLFGGVRWWQSVASGVPATAGTVVLAALPVILGVQMLMAFFNFDTRNVPRVPLHRRLPPT